MCKKGEFKCILPIKFDFLPMKLNIPIGKVNIMFKCQA